MIVRVAALVAIVAMACGAPAPPVRSLDPNAAVTLSYAVAGGGQIRLTVQPRYAVGKPIAFELDISAGTVGVRGPVSGHVLQSDLGGEQTIRRFGPGELSGADAPPGGGAHATIVWDGKDDKGQSVKQDTYSFSMDFIVGGSAQQLDAARDVRLVAGGFFAGDEDVQRFTMRHLRDDVRNGLDVFGGVGS